MVGMVDIRWVWLILHHEDPSGPDARVDRAWDFWSEVTGSTISPRRGDRGELATLVPADGDGWVKLQRTVQGDGIHVDLVVEDVDDAASQAEALGAHRVASYSHGRVMRSPGGFTFCFTSWEAEGEPTRQVREGHDVLLDQVCLDIPAACFDHEAEFWSALTGWGVEVSPSEEFRSLRRAESVPVRFLLQRLGTEEGAVTGHPDAACADRAATVERWVTAGAELLHEHTWWTVMRDPAGLVFCLTDRHPQTGAVPRT